MPKPVIRPMRDDYLEYIRDRLWAEGLEDVEHAWLSWARQLVHQVDLLRRENATLIQQVQNQADQLATQEPPC